MKVYVEFKGLGLTFIDNKPKELIFVCLNQLAVSYKCVTQTSLLEDGSKDTTCIKTEFELTLGNFQIDNMIDDTMPVLIGAQKYYSFNL